MPKGSKKKREFSKIITTVGLSLWVFVTFFAIAMMVITLDLTPLPYVLGSADAVVAAITSFYFWKARAENEIKLQKKYINMSPTKSNAEWD